MGDSANLRAVETMTVTLAAEGLVKRYGDRVALRGVSLAARPGELVAIIGPNGAGKTTLLSILAGIQHADEGSITVAPAGIGWVPQQPAVYNKLTVEENLSLFARLERCPDPRATVDRMLALTDLRDRAGDQVGTLSGGNKQRVNIAIGLLAEPDVLLLDEPSAALDPRQRARLWEFILRLAGEGTTVIYATHNIQEADRYANQLIVLADGELLFDGAAAGARARGRHHRPRLRGGVRRVPPQARPLMRWLLLKDLRILRRSPLLVALLVLYPIVIAVLIGFALSRGPDKPEVAFYNGLEGKSAVVELGGDRIDLAAEGQRLFDAIDPVPRRQQEGGDPEGQGRRRARRADHSRRPRDEHPVVARARDGRGLLQRRGPGQAPVRGEHDQGAGAVGQRGAHQAGRQGGARAARPDQHGRRVQLPRPELRRARPSARRADPDAGAGRAAARTRPSARSSTA